MTEQIVQYDPGQYNVLLPTQTVQQVSPWHAVRASEVRINPDPLAGDVFKVGSRYNETKKAWEDLFTPGKPALTRIAAAAGIVWNWRESGPLTVTRDYVAYKAVGAIRLPDGSWQPISAIKEIDLTVIEEEQLEANLKKANELAAGDEKERAKLKGLTPEQWAEAQTKSAMIQWRKNKLMRAETGAMLRVIRFALGMKSQYTREELVKPFVVPRIDFSPDYSDPMVRQALIENGVQGMAKLYAPTAPAGGGLAAGTAFAGAHPALTAGPEVDDEPFSVVGTEESGGEEAPPAGQADKPTAGAAALTGEDAEVAEALASATPVTQPAGSAQGEAAAECDQCGAPISQKVFRYSVERFDRPLCYKCQQKAKGGGQAS
ncbi:MAG: hypothetical protein QME79_15125 [Bacillota bacterium]|nr:hypothetical protein [Bacillota bacterium]